MRICIDPGHAGQQNRGVNYWESEGNWRFSQVLARVLKERGAEVLMTKTSLNHDPSLTMRGRMAAEWGADVFLSIHSDANNSSARRGVHIIRSISKPDSAALGRRMVDNMAKAMGIPVRDNPVWVRESATRKGFDHYTVIDWSSNYRRMGGSRGRDVPNSYLIECGYHTNPDDAAKLRDASLDLARANAVADALGLAGKEVDIMLKIGDRGQAVADYQTVLIKLGYDLGTWGADGSFGPHTENVTKQAQKDSGIAQDGIVRADLYGKLALRLSVPAKPKDPEVGQIWKVTGRGWASAYQSGNRTQEYKGESMKIARIVSAPSPYGMERNGWIVGWFDRSQLS